MGLSGLGMLGTLRAYGCGMTKRIEVRAARTQQDLLDHECDVVVEFDTIGEAKRKAKYYLTDEYQQRIESSVPMCYAQVVVNDE